MSDSDTRTRSIISWAALALIAYLVYLIVQPILVPIAWATVIAIVFRPVYLRLERRWTPASAAAATTALATVVVVVPLSMIATAFVNEMLEAVRDLQDAVASGRFGSIERGVRQLLQHLPVEGRPEVGPAALEAAQRGAMAIASYSGSVVRNIVTFVFELVFALFASFFLFRDSSFIVSTLRQLVPLDDARRETLMKETGNLVGVSVRASIVVAALQGLLGGIVFAAVGIDAPVFWGVIMALFCLLPLGAWVVWLPAAILLAISGEIGRAVIVAALGFGIVSAVDNFLRPILLAGGTAMNGLLVFIGLFGGVAAFGVIGLVLGPVILGIGSTLLTTYADSRRVVAGSTNDGESIHT